MIKVVGLSIAVAVLVLGLGGSVRAQTLQAGAIALTPGASLTVDGLTFTAESCDYNDGGNRANLCPASDDLFMVPGAGSVASVIIEAANGSTVGTSLLVPLFSFTCGTAGGCTNPHYDMSLTLDVSGKGIGGASVALAGSASPSSLDSEVGGSEVIQNSGNSTICTLDATLADPTAACNFATQGNLSAQKDFGLMINGVADGSTMMLGTITESFAAAPEPASMTLLLGGLIALGAVRGKRRGA